MKSLKSFLGISKKNPKKNKDPTSTTINGLREMEEMLLKKQTFLEEQVQKQLSLAKTHGLKNKRQAILALKRKKRFEQLLQQLDGTLSTLEMQREALESAKNNVAILQAMKSAAVTLKQAQLHMDVDKVHDVMDEIAEQQEVAKEISDAISNPLGIGGFSSDIDDTDLERELEDLEQEALDKDLLKVELTAPEPSGSKTSNDGEGESKTDIRKSKEKKQKPKTEEEKELEDLAQWAAA